jgi:hypothetical protein
MLTYISPVSPLLLAALLLALWELAGGRMPRAPRFGPGSRGLVAAGAVALVAGFVAQLALVAFQALHEAHPAWADRLPYLVVYPVPPLGAEHRLISFAALAIALVQCAALAAFVAPLADAGAAGGGAARLAKRLAPVVAVALGILALGAPAMSSADVFGYVGLGMLGPHPFARPAHFFTGEFARVFDDYPLRPTIYGPLWTATNAFVVGLAHTFAGKVFALRVFGVVLFLAFFAIVHRIVRRDAVTIALLVNPMPWFQCVTNAHNDVLGACMLAGAVALADRRKPFIAAILVAAAGLVKFPFVLLGALAFVREGPRRAFAFAALAGAICFAASALFGGRDYFDALASTGGITDASVDPLIKYVKVLLAVGAAGITAIIMLRGRFPAFGGFVYPAIAPIFYPWYLLWAVCYSLAARRAMLLTLLALPLVGVLADGVYTFHGFTLLVPLAALAWIARAASSSVAGKPGDGETMAS